MKRSPLKRKTPLKRSPMKRGKRNTKYARRERDTVYMLAVKQLQCVVPMMVPHRFFQQWMDLTRTDPERAAQMRLLWDCDGQVEADHMGDRGLGTKAADQSCVPMCRKHHDARTRHVGVFRPATREDMRQWKRKAINLTMRNVAGLMAASARQSGTGPSGASS